ncbi:MAG: hypothetical protein R6U04_12015 [Bacteroidales bacterium]
MQKIYSVSTLFLFSVLLFSCQNDTAHVKEQFGEGIIQSEDSVVIFYKSITFIPDKKNIDTSKLKTDVSLFFYQPYAGKVHTIKTFEKINNWPAAWQTHLAYSENLVGFSLKNTRKNKRNENEGIYLYNIGKSKIRKIEDHGEKFWISPDEKLLLYHLINENRKTYRLYGYDTEEDKTSLYNESQPMIKNIEWLENGKAALLITEKKDSAIRIDLKN